jgi:hypothetical protein
MIIHASHVYFDFIHNNDHVDIYRFLTLIITEKWNFWRFTPHPRIINDFFTYFT